MTQDEIIEMAKQVGYPIQHPEWQKATEEFAALLEEKATERANARANKSWILMCEKMVAFEREACAKVCDEHSDDPVYCGEAIRARGQA
jgi:DNA-binding GntR family transcriptional regulator